MYSPVHSMSRIAQEDGGMIAQPWDRLRTPRDLQEPPCTGRPGSDRAVTDVDASRSPQAGVLPLAGASPRGIRSLVVRLATWRQRRRKQRELLRVVRRFTG